MGSDLQNGEFIRRITACIILQLDWSCGKWRCIT